MRVAVVILNWNAAEDTAACLDSIARWRVGPARDRPVVWVVDNASTEPGLNRLVRDHPEVRFVLSEVNRGFGGGNNLAISAALEEGADLLLLLNNDARISAADLDALIERIESDDGLGVVGPTLWHGEELLAAGGRDIGRYGRTHLRPARPPDGPVEVDYVPGTVALVRRELFEAVGLFDEEYFFAGEMADLCRRASQAGLRCMIEPGARATHDPERSRTEREVLHSYYVLRNRLLFVRRHHSTRLASLSALWMLRAARSVVTALAGGKARRAAAVSVGLWDGLRGRFGRADWRFLGSSAGRPAARAGSHRQGRS